MWTPRCGPSSRCLGLAGVPSPSAAPTKPSRARPAGGRAGLASAIRATSVPPSWPGHHAARRALAGVQAGRCPVSCPLAPPRFPWKCLPSARSRGRSLPGPCSGQACEPVRACVAPFLEFFGSEQPGLSTELCSQRPPGRERAAIVQGHRNVPEHQPAWHGPRQGTGCQQLQQPGHPGGGWAGLQVAGLSCGRVEVPVPKRRPQSRTMCPRGETEVASAQQRLRVGISWQLHPGCPKPARTWASTPRAHHGQASAVRAEEGKRPRTRPPHLPAASLCHRVELGTRLQGQGWRQPTVTAHSSTALQEQEVTRRLLARAFLPQPTASG